MRVTPFKHESSKIGTNICFILCAALCMFLLCGPTEVKAAQAKHIMFLQAQTEELPSAKIFENGFKKQFALSGEKNFEYSYVYLELFKFSFEPKYQERMAIFLKEKYSLKEPDLVVTYLGPAADFALKYGREIFPRAQFLLVEHEGDGVSAEELPRGYGGVTSVFNVKETVKLVQTMQPEVRQIYVVLGSSEREQQMLKYFQKDVVSLTRQIEFVYLNNMSFDQMIDTIRSVRNNAAIIYLFVYQDVTGKTFISANEMKTVSEAANVPVYAPYNTYMGRGAMGGYMMSTQVLGAKAAEAGMARLKSQGGPSKSIMVQSAEYQFDWRELKRWGIDESKLPSGSKIFFKELTVWEQYRGYIICAVVLFVLLSSLTIGLLINRSRRLKAEEELKSAKEHYKTLMEQAYEAFALADIETQEVVEINHRFTEMFGYSLPEDAPLYVNRYVVDSQQNLDIIYNNTLRQQFALPPEMRMFRHKNGTLMHVEMAAAVMCLEGRSYVLESMRDMTAERRRRSELKRDVEFARRVQRELLPDLTESPLVDICTIYHPANIVSGDSYYMKWRNEGELLRGFLIDITGHGLATALQTASISALLQETSITDLTLMEQIHQINLRAEKYFSEGSYASMLGFELDFTTMELRYAGAGITQFYFNGTKIMTPGMLVGMWENAEFETGTIPISEGDCMHFLTDGFTDRLNQPENANLWSLDGKDFDADVAALEQLAEKGELLDDATGLCFRINGMNR